MAGSKIVIKFNANNAIGLTVSFNIRRTQYTGISILSEKIELSRSNYGVTAVSADIYGDQPSRPYHLANRFAYYFRLDYNASGKYLIEATGDEVHITNTSEEFYFYNPVTAGVCTMTITNKSDEDDIFITDWEGITLSSNQCSNFKLKFTFSAEITGRYVNGNYQSVSNLNELELECLRDEPYVFRFSKDYGNGIIKDVYYPVTGYFKVPILLASNFTVEKTESTGGVNIKVSPEIPMFKGYRYHYSIDSGANWNDTGNFLALADGSYTILIKDVLFEVDTGCQVSINEDIESGSNYGITINPYIHIPESNSIMFKKSEEIDNVTIYENYENSFSNKYANQINYCHEVFFTNNDDVKIQFKSSYNNITGVLRKDNGSEYNLIINKLTDNINVFQSLYGAWRKYDDGSSIMYFPTGYYLDENGDPIGTYDTNTSLPSLAFIGHTIEIVGVGMAKIIDIFYYDVYGVNVILLDIPLNGSEAMYLIKSIQNILPYNVFDFSILFSLYGDGVYDIKLTFQNDSNDIVDYISENIVVNDFNKELLYIRYYNDNNRHIFYKYPIHHLLRLPIIDISTFVKDEIDINITDVGVDVVKSTVNRGLSIKFDALTNEQLNKLVLALSCKYVFINNIKFVKYESFSIENIEGTNLYNLEAKMLKDSSNYENIINEIDRINSGSNVDLGDVNIINDNTNFIKY